MYYEDMYSLSMKFFDGSVYEDNFGSLDEMRSVVAKNIRNSSSGYVFRNGRVWWMYWRKFNGWGNVGKIVWENWEKFMDLESREEMRREDEMRKNRLW